MRFIGEDLDEREVAALQAVAHNAGGAQFGRLGSINKIIKSHRDCQVIEGISLKDFKILLDKLQKDGLIERKLIDDKQYVGLTEDGKRCNLIEIY